MLIVEVFFGPFLVPIIQYSVALDMHLGENICEKL